MSNEEEQFAQRLAKLEELRRLGVAPYPTRFERTETVQSVISTFGASEAEALEADRPKVAVAGRVLGVRSFGKARFLVLSDGLERLQVYVRADSMDERSFQIVTHVDLGRSRRCGRAGVPHEDEGAHDLGRTHRVPREGAAAASGEVARPDGHRDAVSPAISRPDRQSRVEEGVRDACAGRRRDPALSGRQGIPRSRDADDAADCRRRARTALRHASQHPGPRALPPCRAGAVPEASGRRRL